MEAVLTPVATRLLIIAAAFDVVGAATAILALRPACHRAESENLVPDALAISGV